MSFLHLQMSTGPETSSRISFRLPQEVHRACYLNMSGATVELHFKIWIQNKLHYTFFSGLSWAWGEKLLSVSELVKYAWPSCIMLKQVYRSLSSGHIKRSLAWHQPSPWMQGCHGHRKVMEFRLKLTTVMEKSWIGAAMRRLTKEIVI